MKSLHFKDIHPPEQLAQLERNLSVLVSTKPIFEKDLVESRIKIWTDFRAFPFPLTAKIAKDTWLVADVQVAQVVRSSLYMLELHLHINGLWYNVQYEA